MSHINSLQKEMLNTLLDRYEHSRRFMGLNKNERLPQFELSKLYPAYADDSEYAFFCECNEAVYGLEKEGLVTAGRGRGEVIGRVILCVDKLDAVYKAAGRKPRADVQAELREILKSELADPVMKEGRMYTLAAFLSTQLERLEENRDIEYFTGDIQEYKNLLLMVREVLLNDEECYIRDLSVRLYQDSKKAEEYRGRVESLLYAYGEYAEKNTILEEHGILRTPAYVMLKGGAKIVFPNESIDLAAMGGDIGFSTESLKNIVRIEMSANRVMTVENLTSFHDLKDKDALVIYLGGFHNHAKRMLLRKIYDDNPGGKYEHFGDMDAGGLYILRHLREKTGIPFEPLFMDKETLMRYREQALTLTPNDRKRLKKLKEYYATGTISELIDYMLAESIKLEQEVITSQYP